MSAPDTDDLSGLSYEQARDQLVEVVHRLESGEVELSEALALWQRGEKLAAACQERLDGARAVVEAARPSDSED